MRRGARMRVSMLAASLALPFSALSGADAADPEAPVVVAGPGAAATARFATPLTVVRAGEPASLLNTDINWHGIESEEFGTDDRPWCGPLDPTLPESPANPRRKPLGECPLFVTDYAMALGDTAPFEGLEAATPGRVYAFSCTVVSGMAGNLIVEAI